MAASRSSSRSRRRSAGATVDGRNILAGLRKRGRKLSNHPGAVVSRQRRAKEKRRLLRAEKKNTGKVASEWLGARGEGEDMDPETRDRPEPAVVARPITSGRHDHHIAADGSRQPGLNQPATDADLNKKLEELRYLVVRMESLAAIQRSGRAIEEAAGCDDRPYLGEERSTRAVATPRISRHFDGDKASPSPTGVIEVAINRIVGATDRVQGARNVLHSRIERICGTIPETGDHRKDAPDMPSGQVHQLHAMITLLELEIESLHEHVDRLSGL